MKKRILLIGGLLSLFALASCDEETRVEYKEQIVEVEKPVEVIKEVEVVKEVPVKVEVEKTVYVDRPVEVEKIVEKTVTVEVPVEKIVEVEKPVYVEKSQVDLNGIDVVKVDDNLYEFEFTAAECHTEKLLQIKKIFDLNGIYISDDYTCDTEVFRRGELVSKPGYIIKDILLANPRKMGTPYVLDNDYNNILPSNIADFNHTVAALKYEYNNIDKEKIHISFNKSGIGEEHYGAEIVRVVFSIRKQV
jgi:hypothetical protein